MITSSNENIFRVTGHLCAEFTGHGWIPRTKASNEELWCFLWSAWLNGWENNGDADDLRRHRAHYDATAMNTISISITGWCWLWSRSFVSHPLQKVLAAHRDFQTETGKVVSKPYHFKVFVFNDSPLPVSLIVSQNKPIVWRLCFSTLRPRQMATIFQTIFSNAFSWMKMCWFRLMFHWSLFPRVKLTIFQHWFI